MQRPQPSPHSTTSGSTNRNSNAMSTTTALFTASEHHAFDAFLTASVEPPEDEWQLYTQLGIPVPLPPQGNSSLTKATKDLIALHPPSKYPPIHGGPNSAAGSSSQPMLNSMAAHHRPIAPAPPPELAPRPQQQQYHQPVQQSHVPSADRPPKRARHSHASSTTIQSPSPTASQPTALTKPALLSAQQKKANHIQSEQKRRANIRRGYEALCETIPALREAIRAEEEAATTSSGTGKKRRARDEGGEKVDGRAGPRSESVVLQKSKCAVFICE